MALAPALQLGLPEFLPGLIGIASAIVMLLILTAFGGFIYKSLTGGVEWPDEKEADDDTVSRGDSDDEWEYY